MTGGAGAMVAPSGTGAWLERERERVNEVLRDISDAHTGALAPALREPVGYALATQGKRLRPILTASAFRAAAGRETSPAVYRLGCAIEIVHTYSLVHDDLPCMDDDDLRRGRPTVHRIHGVGPAVVAGAALLPLAVRVLLGAAAELGLPTAAAGRLAVELCAAAGAEGMVGGQLRDLEAERRPVSGAELEAIHRAKTGALLTAALRIGAVAGGASPAALDAVTRYGRAIGLAFQITDDVLDVEGDTMALGKLAGRDQALSKASYPALHGLDGARRLARERADEAKAAFRDIAAPDLIALADYVVQRER
jgi:geranylgeranyl diphosphate synthase type II